MSAAALVDEYGLDGLNGVASKTATGRQGDRAGGPRDQDRQVGGGDRGPRRDGRFTGYRWAVQADHGVKG